MNILIKLIGWDFKLQLKYNIVTIAIVIASLYILLLRLLPYSNLDYISILLIISDPTMFGVLFIGALVLYEKDNNTLNALIVTPLRPSHYLLSKAISLTIVAVPIALVIGLFGHGVNIGYFSFLISVTLSSLIFVFLGFVIVSKSKGFNQFVIKFAVFTIPVSLPFLSFFNLVHSNLFYLIPSQATILLLKRSFNYNVENWEYIYAISYLLIWTYVSFYAAVRAYSLNLLDGKS